VKAAYAMSSGRGDITHYLYLNKGLLMFNPTVLKGFVLTASMVLATTSFSAMAEDEDGKCRPSYLSYIWLPEATPEQFEFIRKSHGAREIRVEREGETYSQEFNAYRVRVFVGMDESRGYETVSTGTCG
jgi:NDP-sugar pyrophosphorylase family protein